MLCAIRRPNNKPHGDASGCPAPRRISLVKWNVVTTLENARLDALDRQFRGTDVQVVEKYPKGFPQRSFFAPIGAQRVFLPLYERLRTRPVDRTLDHARAVSRRRSRMAVAKTSVQDTALVSDSRTSSSQRR
jgi:hypothetical protein